MRGYMRKGLIYAVATLLVLILIVVIINYNAVNIKDQASLVEGISRYMDIIVNRILMSKSDENEYFVLFEDESGDLHLCIFEETVFSFGRYYNAMGGSSGGNPNDFIYSEGTGSGRRQLSVAYGETSALPDGVFEVLLENETLTIRPTDKYFLEIFREETQELRMIRFEFN